MSIDATAISEIAMKIAMVIAYARAYLAAIFNAFLMCVLVIISFSFISLLCDVEHEFDDCVRE